MMHIPPLAYAKLKREHAELGAKAITLGPWPFRRIEYEISCSCGWVDPKTIPLMPVELKLTEDFLLRTRMERHLRQEIAKLPAWRRIL